MPFKNKAQARAMAAKMDRGELSKKTFQEFADATPSIKNLPPGPKPKGKKK